MTKSQELKEKIIKEQLANLSVDPLGSYVNAEELSKCTYKFYEDYYYNCLPAVEIDPDGVLTEKEYQEICQAMIDNIKKHANEWRIEKEGSLTILEHDSGKKHYKEGFEEEEWKEIEKFFNTKIQEENKKNMVNWKDIDINFTEELQKEWIERGFSYEACKEWIDIGLVPSDNAYCAWLKNIKKLNAEQVLNSGNEQQLRGEYNNNLVATQQWLEENYPNKGVWKIYINQQLEGELDLRGYDKLHEVSISHQVDKNKFGIKNAFYKQEGKNEETKIVQSVNAQEWLDENYPKDGVCKEQSSLWKNENFGKERKDVGTLQIVGDGSLLLKDFINLIELDCSGNQLTHLDLSQNKKLEKLIISNNNFPKQDLFFLSHLINLKKLYLANNRFVGSLEFLKNMSNLNTLNIKCADIDSGVEYLSNSVKWFSCSEDQGIYKLFANEQGETETIKLNGVIGIHDTLECIEDFPQKLHLYKKLIALKQSQNIMIDDWTDINSNFAKKNDWDSIYQQYLEEKGFDKEKAEEYIQTFFELKYYKTIKKWKKYHNLNVQQTREWLSTGLTRKEFKLIFFYIQQKNLTLSQVKDNLEKLREEYNTHLLSEWYPLEERENEESIIIQGRNLHGNLIIQNFPQLETIYCNNNQLTSLEISNFSNLCQLFCGNNKLTNLSFLDNLNPEKITSLDLSKNNLQQGLDVLGKFTNLECLLLNDNSLNGSLKPLENLANLRELDISSTQIVGSLKPLGSCLKLETLDISNTNIMEGLEYLPKDLEVIRCTGQLAEALKPFKEEQKNEEEEEEYDDNYYKLQTWRENNQELVAKAQARILLKDEFQVQEQQIQELQEQLTNLQNKYQQNLQTQQSSLQELEQEKFTLETKLKDAISETTILQQQADKLQQELGSAADNYQKLAIELAEKKDNSPTLDEKELREAEAEIERLEKALLGAKNDLEEKKKQVLDLQKSLVDKSREIKKVQAEKQIELDALQAEKEILQLDVDSLQGKLKKNEEDLGNKKKELTGVKKKLKEQLQQSKSLELTRFLRKDEKDFQGEVERLKKDMKKLEKQLNEKEKEIANVTYNINEINVNQGHAMIGNTMKDDTNLSYNLEKALETNMEIPPK